MEKCKVEEYWVARDKDGQITIYNQKPYKDKEHKQWILPEPTGEFIDVDEMDDWFGKNVKWTDKEPRRVTIILED